MELAHEQHGHMDDAHSVAHHYGPRTLPAVLDAPPMVAEWRKRMVVIAIVATIVSLIFGLHPANPAIAIEAASALRNVLRDGALSAPIVSGANSS